MIFWNNVLASFDWVGVYDRGTDEGEPIPPCMGYELAPSEDSFERKAVDAL